MTGTGLEIAAVSIDCGDARGLADFYADLLGGTIIWSTPTSAGVRCGAYVLSLQQLDGYEPPAWPGSPVWHLDLNGDADVAELVESAVGCGARVADHQPDPRWTVLLDPAGHPFCITPFSPPE